MLSEGDKDRFDSVFLQLGKLRSIDFAIRAGSVDFPEIKDLSEVIEKAASREPQRRLVGKTALVNFPYIALNYMRAVNSLDKLADSAVRNLPAVKPSDMDMNDEYIVELAVKAAEFIVNSMQETEQNQRLYRQIIEQLPPS